MCAIAGIFSYRHTSGAVDRSELLTVRDHMATRGPDGCGDWFDRDRRIGLAHRRLAIIDLSDTAAQPMHGNDGRHSITFNGEIYNYKALRQKLIQKGYVFRTHSDTEVLLHLYADKGEAMVGELRGMFAFAIWDHDCQALFLARDPYGIKPLYYANDGGKFRFASQVKALLAGGGVSTTSEPAGWLGFYIFGSVPEPFTTYQQIRALPAGATLWVDGTGPHSPTRYYSIARTWCDAERRAHGGEVDGKLLDDTERGARIGGALLDSVRHHMVADVPVGSFLSAGIDSGALVGLMRDAGQSDIQTVTLTFEEFRGKSNDEAPLAEELAALYGTRHTTRVVTREEFHKDLPLILEAMDQPSIDGINTWFVAKAARELGLKVAISGLGGDELFGGYPSFHEIPRWVRWLAVPAKIPLLGDAFRHAVSALGPLSKRLNPKFAGLIKYGGDYAGAYLLRRGLFMPWELADVMDEEMVQEGLNRLSPVRHIADVLVPSPATPFGRVASLESSLYMRNQLLRDTDWAGMAHSLEVRVPLVDHKLLESIAPLITGQNTSAGKQWLAAAPKQPLPDHISNRAKTGFSIPVAKWLHDEETARGWRQVPALTAPQTPWARRWAYSVANA